MKTAKPIEEVLQPAQVGKTTTIRGWVYRKRTMKDKVFLVIRDTTDIIQVVINQNSRAWPNAQKITMESSCYITGKVRQDKRAPTGYEIDVSAMDIVGLAEVFPIARDLSEEFLLDVRHLWLRSRKMQAVLKVRSKVFESIHEFFRKKGYYEFHSPIFLQSACEGGSTLFDVKYFNKKVHLSQSWQLHCETALPSVEKIYTVTPAFRAEKSKTTRHLSEYWTAEVEQAWIGLDELQKIAEELVSYVCQYAAKNCKKELAVLGRDPKELEAIKSPFPRITYTKALEILAKDGMKIKWGKDLRTLEERQLMKHYKKPLIVTSYPKDVKAFYMPIDPKDPRAVLAMDVLAPETGDEIIGGSQRSTDLQELLARMKASGIKRKDYEFYLDTRRYGTIPHAGFGLGIERVVQWICKLPSIRDAIPFPRTITRTYP
jgi:asparaginyl-tRNA synthetase